MSAVTTLRAAIDEVQANRDQLRYEEEPQIDPLLVARALVEMADDIAADLADIKAMVESSRDWVT